MPVAAIARILSTSSHNRPRPDPYRRRYVISSVGVIQHPTLLYSKKKREHGYLSGGFSSMYSWCLLVSFSLNCKGTAHKLPHTQKLDALRFAICENGGPPTGEVPF
ncbi:hypothetical protein AVEN_179853-1 [Araneus ventricosus]|uniref:Uncharacterized protein n=1 Tax=Araneus ventricosus TaxID=182803 RepID=A0A4Y2LJL4_ARAVE|nr:hypothetical protein AVEN_179853-1 [Araneus ventricosus]